MLKEWIHLNYPDLREMGNSEEEYQRLCTIIEEAWNALDQDKIDNLIRSMPRRVLAVWEADGWHIKY